MQVDLAGMELEARSLGGIETCIEVPLHKLAFDIGRCPDTALRRSTVLVTHAHIDHLAGLPWHAAMRALRGMSEPLYVVPPEIVPGLEALFAAWDQLDNGVLPHRLQPLAPGERHTLRRGLEVEPFRAPHRTVAQGYALIETRRSLRSELRGLPGEELGERRRRGEEVDEVEEIVQLAFTGDTRIEVVERSHLVREARRLVIECTFLDDAVPPADAARMGHVHLRQLAQVGELLEAEAILLTHFSARYRRRDILAALDRELSPELRARVQPLLPGAP